MTSVNRTSEMRTALKTNISAYRHFMELNGDRLLHGNLSVLFDGYLFAIFADGAFANLFVGYLNPKTAHQAKMKPRNVGARYHKEYPDSHIMVGQLGQAEPVPYFVS